MLHISVGNSKMGEIPSFSLPPITTCRKGVPCAKKCYAKRFWPNVLSSYKENYEEASNLIRFENLMNAWIREHKPAVFRIHVSGDFFSAQYLNVWKRIARRYPGTQFFAFTKQWDVLRTSIQKNTANFTIILSAWMPIGDVDVWLPPKDLMDKYPVSYVVDPKKRSEQIVALEKAIGMRRLLRTQECSGNCDGCGKCFHRRKRDGDILFSLH